MLFKDANESRFDVFVVFGSVDAEFTRLGTNISPPNECLKMIFLFARWDMSSFPGGYICRARNHPFKTKGG